MIILAIDTTENTAAVAVTDDEKLLGSSLISAQRTHSETLLPMTESLMRDLKLDYDQIDLFALSAGPGSFTGVRIGAAAIKGLAFGRNKPCIAVSALEALAVNLSGFSGILCPGMDARRGQLYNALFSSDGESISRLTPDRVILAEELREELTSFGADRKIRFCGGGYAIMMQACEDLPGVCPTPVPLRPENGYSVAVTALRSYLTNPAAAVSDIALKPVYLRASQAERERLERESKNNS